MNHTEEYLIENKDRRIFMRQQASNIFELTKGFSTQTTDVAMLAAIEMAGYVLELTAHDYKIYDKK